MVNIVTDHASHTLCLWLSTIKYTNLENGLPSLILFRYPPWVQKRTCCHAVMQKCHSRCREINFTWRKKAIKDVNFHLKIKTNFTDIFRINKLKTCPIYWKIIFLSSASKKKNILSIWTKEVNLFWCICIIVRRVMDLFTHWYKFS